MSLPHLSNHIFPLNRPDSPVYKEPKQTKDRNFEPEQTQIPLHTEYCLFRELTISNIEISILCQFVIYRSYQNPIQDDLDQKKHDSKSSPGNSVIRISHLVTLLNLL